MTGIIMKLRIAGLLYSLAILSGCATVETTGIGLGKSGIAYHLPKGEFELTVVDNQGVLAVSLAGPVMVPDPSYPLIARLPHSGTSDNVVTVSVDPKTNLLTKVDAASTGQLSTIIKNVAQTVAFLQSSDGQTGTVIFDRNYDTDGLRRSAGKEINEFLDQYFSHACDNAIAGTAPYATELKSSGYTDHLLKGDRKVRLQYCQKLKVAGLGSAATSNLVQITVEDPLAASTASWGSSAAVANLAEAGKLCAKGICYRPMTAMKVYLTVLGAFSKSDVFLIPDVTRLQSLPLAQGVFTNQKYTLTFSDGVPTEFLQDSKSEIVAFSSLPLDVIKAIISAPAQALGLRTENLKAQGAYLDQVAAYQTSQKSLAAACQTSSIKCPTRALKMIGGTLASDTKISTQTTTTPADQGALTKPAENKPEVHQDNPDDQ